jgi:PASTA domain
MAALGWLLNLDFAASESALVAVPNVVGETEAQGTTDLGNAGFGVAVLTAYSSVVAAGLIISQNPAAGSTPGNGSTVTITVSLGDAPVAPVAQPSGGFFYDIDHFRSRKRAERDRLARHESDTAHLQQVEREIAELLRDQERKDIERDELSRIQRLADDYSGRNLGLPRRVSASLLKAYEERSRNALEQLQRELERMLEEEEVALMLLLNDD